MKIAIIIIVVLLVIIMILFKSKEKFKNQILYPEIHNYHKDSYKYGLHGRKRNNQLFFGRFSDYIPFIKHLILT